MLSRCFFYFFSGCRGWVRSLPYSLYAFDTVSRKDSSLNCRKQYAFSWWGCSTVGQSFFIRLFHTVKSTVRSLTLGLFTRYFRFQSTCNRNKFVWVSRWLSGFYITKSPKERHWTPFYPPNTLREREYNFPVVRMFLREFSHKQWAETSVHRATHIAVTKMTIVNCLDNVLQHNFNKQF